MKPSWSMCKRSWTSVSERASTNLTRKPRRILWIVPQDSTMPRRPSKMPTLTLQPPQTGKKVLQKSLELATTAVKLAERTIPIKEKNFFSLYETLLGDNARVKWPRIVDTQIGAAPWTDKKMCRILPVSILCNPLKIVQLFTCCQFSQTTQQSDKSIT